MTFKIENANNKLDWIKSTMLSSIITGGHFEYRDRAARAGRQPARFQFRVPNLSTCPQIPPVSPIKAKRRGLCGGECGTDLFEFHDGDQFNLNILSMCISIRHSRPVRVSAIQKNLFFLTRLEEHIRIPNSKYSPNPNRNPNPNLTIMLYFRNNG